MACARLVGTWTLVLLAFGSVAGSLAAAELLRGPYLLAMGATEVTIRWRTDARVERAALHWGLGPGRFDRSQLARSLPSSTERFTDWVVSLEGLAPETAYSYAVEADWAWFAGGGRALQFETASAREGAPLRFWFLGDSGSNRPRPGATIAPFGDGAVPHPIAVREGFRRYLGTRRLDGIVLLGDNAYPLGTDRQYQAAFFNLYREELARVPLWPCVGNHDLDDAYESIFQGAAPGDQEGAPYYYSFDVGPVHFSVLDPWKSWLETTSDPADPRWQAQLTWLRRDLAETERHWRIVVNHFPVYCDGNYDSDTNGPLRSLRGDLVPIFDEFGVDLAIAGHDHTYQRSYLIRGHTGTRNEFDPAIHLVSSTDGRVRPITKSTGENGGTVYVVSGTAGGTRRSGRFSHPVFVPLDGGLGSGRGVAIAGSFVLEVEGQRLVGRQIDSEGETVDRFDLVKPMGAENP